MKKQRTDWLRDKIDDLIYKEMFDELSEADMIFLDGYRSELKIINLKEQGFWRSVKSSIFAHSEKGNLPTAIVTSESVITVSL